jgi:hypothetical protein
MVPTGTLISVLFSRPACMQNMQSVDGEVPLHSQPFSIRTNWEGGAASRRGPQKNSVVRFSFELAFRSPPAVVVQPPREEPPTVRRRTAGSAHTGTGKILLPYPSLREGESERSPASDFSGLERAGNAVVTCSKTSALTLLRHRARANCPHFSVSVARAPLSVHTYATSDSASGGPCMARRPRQSPLPAGQSRAQTKIGLACPPVRRLHACLCTTCDPCARVPRARARACVRRAAPCIFFRCKHTICSMGGCSRFVKSSQVKSIQKQQTTIRKPIECAPEASRGGRESMEMAEGDPS